MTPLDITLSALGVAIAVFVAGFGIGVLSLVYEHIDYALRDWRYDRRERQCRAREAARNA